MKILIALMLVFTTACTSCGRSNKDLVELVTEVDDDLYPHYVEFLEYSDKYDARLMHHLDTMVFGDPVTKTNPDTTKILARCYYKGYRTHVIIKPKLRDDCRLKGVVFHELGHCLLGIRGHYSADADKIMQKSFNRADCKWLEERWEEVVEELFTKPGPTGEPKE